jgi:hypothetical protein
VVIGGFFYWTSLLCTNQASVQKALSLRKRKTANWAIFYAIIGECSILNNHTVMGYSAMSNKNQIGNIIFHNNLDVFGFYFEKLL